MVGEPFEFLQWSRSTASKKMFQVIKKDLIVQQVSTTHSKLEVAGQTVTTPSFPPSLLQGRTLSMGGVGEMRSPLD